MIANARYTALEILEAAEVPDAAKVFGKMAVIIGGITGIVKPDHIIRLPSGTEELVVIVGNKKYDVEIEDEAEEHEVSEGVQSVYDARAVEAKKAEAAQKAVEAKQKPQA